jgi:hypothetical protein
MASMEHPYTQFEATALWEALDAEIAELEDNGDLKLTTARQYVIGSLCQRLINDQLAVPSSGSPVKPPPV